MTSHSSFQNAVKWAYAASWGEKGLSAVFMFVMAAILGPRDFGVFSIAVVYISLLQMFLDQGLALALIQIRTLESKHLNTVFWFDLGLSTVLVGLSLLFRNALANLNHAPDAAVVIAAISPSIMLEAAAIVPMSILKRQMDFKSISIRTNASMLAGCLVGIAFGLAGFRLWALVAQQLVRDAVAVALLWKLTPWRAKREFSWSHFRQLLPFSSANFLGQLGSFCDGQGSAILLGAMFGPAAVGIYRLGERISNSVITMSMSSIQSVALPEFARLRDQPLELRRTALHCIRLSSIITVPVLTTLAVVGYSLMVTIGARWVPAVGVLRILSISGLIMVFSFFTGPLLQGINRARTAAILEWCRVSVGLVALCIAGWLVRGNTPDVQVLGIAISKCLVGALLVTPGFVLILLKTCEIRVAEFAATCAPSLVACVGIAIIVPAASKVAHFGALPPVAQLCFQGFLGAVVGLSVIFLLDAEVRGSIRTKFQWLQTRGSVNG